MIKKTSRLKSKGNIVLLLEKKDQLPPSFLTGEEFSYVIRQKEKQEKDLVVLNRYDHLVVIQFIKEEASAPKRWENCRIAGDRIGTVLNDHKIREVILLDVEGRQEETLALAEGMELGNYQFLAYKKDPGKKKNSLETISICSKSVTPKMVDLLNSVCEGTSRCRNLINEPVINLNAARLAGEIEKMGKEVGAEVEILNRKKIEALKMGGLLAVNKGSLDPPTFSIFSWKPPKPVNKKPYVLVGKGIVFDTGGLNIKSGNYMDNMKYDMAGAAAAAAVVYSVAKAGLPVHVIALIPATDNRPGGNAYAPGDVICMYDGTTVEVLNTDAEGRLILADALSYAKNYDPELVIDIATLTGAAAMAIGKYGIVAMKSKSDDEFAKLKTAGDAVYERIVEFPFWEEYGELIKSDVAEIKNIGGREAGAITAGKFLEHFTAYPYIHLDIAGPVWSEKKDSYRGTGATGVGVRLLFEFLRRKYQNDQ
ncbi:MAG TPA: leucyl aminopeptidase [Bacteroidales bacterium]|nr:leucyl aminopeptidase [Bacteroidales bacterium]HNS47205.1 leucyl aminopeptidase [Bacteroidales bacterium]